jgi:hypothetical protein
MSPIVVSKKQAAPNIDGGTYTLELAEVREVQVDDWENPGQKASRIELTFTICDPSSRWDGKQFTDLCTPRMGPKSKLGQIMTALNGGMAIRDGDIDLEAFIGRRMQAAIRRKENGYNQIFAETAVSLEPVAPDGF